MLKSLKENGVLLEVKKKFSEIIKENKLDDVRVSVLVKTLTPEEAIVGSLEEGIFQSLLAKKGLLKQKFWELEPMLLPILPGNFQVY